MMTPGYAKPRSKLPWLPYPESDKVFVINSHNFGGGSFSPAVNGKMPIAAWIPSRDDAGNGTTTLTDLAGANNGTLTNMDAATDWVSDTGAGGVRALDFDGSNDFVSFGNNSQFAFTSNPATFSVSSWVKFDSVSGGRTIVSKMRNDNINSGWAIQYATDRWFGIVAEGSFGSRTIHTAVQSISTGVWVHLVAVFDGSATDKWKFWVNGSSLTVGKNENSGAFAASNALDVRLGAMCLSANTALPANLLDGRQDDTRIWDVALNGTDVADLFAGGNGRGVDAS